MVDCRNKRLTTLTKQFEGKAFNGLNHSSFRLTTVKRRKETKVNKKLKENSVFTGVKLDKKTRETLEKWAIKEGVTISELIREFIVKGMSIGSYKEEIDFIRQQIREEISMQLKPAIDRLVKITVKSGIVSAAGYFLCASALSEFVHPARQKEYEEVLAESKKLGVYYFRLPSKEAEEFM